MSSLFMPINEALEVIEEQLKNDETLEDRITWSLLTITDLIKCYVTIHITNKTLGRAQDPCANGAWLSKLTE